MIDKTIDLVSNWRPKNDEDAMLKHEMLIDAIRKHIPQTLLKYSSIEWNTGTPSEPAPIWVCWLDGPNDMPEVVSRCIRSVCDHSRGHPVKFIDWNNISKYVSIPDRITALRDDGTLCTAHYCDVMRLMLLFEYGGLWVDADTFLSRDIPEDYFSKPFATAKNNLQDIPYKESLNYVGKGQWHVSIIGAQKGNSLIGFILDAFIEFLSNNDRLHSYYFMDYTFELARRQFPQAAVFLKEGAVQNGRHCRLNAVLRGGFPLREYERAIQSDTVFNVLNWKREYPQLTAEGKPTAFSAFLENPKADTNLVLGLR